MTVAFFNQRFMALSEVSISPLDRGFLFGDGVYEVIPCYQGRLFRLDRHLGRLENSLEAIRIANPMSKARWEQTLIELVDRNGAGDQLVYLQITRGVAPRDHKFPDAEQPTVFAMTKHWTRPDTPRPAKVITASDNRWERCDIKATTLLANVLLRQEAVEAGADECLLVREGSVIEGAASNVFVVTGKRVTTPAKRECMLSGISREVVLEVLGDLEVAVEESVVPVDQLWSADEIWITSSSMEIRPVISVDSRVVSKGVPGELWSRVIERFHMLTGTS